MNRLFLLPLLLLAALLFPSCTKYTEEIVETGYKGKARLNPWLAAERYAAARTGREVIPRASWVNPDYGETVWFVPAAVIGNESFTSRLLEWVEEGGHLVLLMEYSEAEWNDWSKYYRLDREPEPALLSLLEKVGLVLEPGKRSAYDGNTHGQEEIVFLDRTYKVDAGSEGRVRTTDGKPGVFASRSSGNGRVSVLMDARLFRNRYLAEKDHASFLRALIEADPHNGSVVFLKGSGISFWDMLGRHLWPVLLGLGAVVAFWLWRSFSRFGPLEPAAMPSPLRAYDHHLEALGDYQWRLDRCEALLAPLRERIVEHGQRLAARMGHRDADFLQFLAERADISRDRVQRAISREAPPDPALFTITAADIRRLLDVIT